MKVEGKGKVKVDGIIEGEVNIDLEGLINIINRCEDVLRYVTRGDLQRIEFEAGNRVEKWLSTRGKELGESFTDGSKAKLYYQYYTRCFLDTVVSNVLTLLGLKGSEKVDYYRIGYAVWRCFNVETTYGVIPKLLDMWNKLPEYHKKYEHLNLDVLKKVFIVSIQAVVYCRRKFIG